jgi:hypothetical protein
MNQTPTKINQTSSAFLLPGFDESNLYINQAPTFNTRFDESNPYNSFIL